MLHVLYVPSLSHSIALLKPIFYQGHRTYPAFVHFLCSVTLLATYVGAVGANALWYAFDNPFAVVSSTSFARSSETVTKIVLGLYFILFKQHELTPVHELIITFAGIIFALVIGPFAAYHLYLISCVSG